MIRSMTGLRMLALAGTALFGLAGTASAQGFECPRKGGDLVFGLEARVATLDQHATNTPAVCANYRRAMELEYNFFDANV